MKKKSLATLISGLLAVSLVGVGFASWVIIQGASEQKEGSVNVETITKTNISIEANWADNDEDYTCEKLTEEQKGMKNEDEEALYTEAVDADDSQLSFGSSSQDASGWLRNTSGKIERKSLKLNVAIGGNDSVTSYVLTFSVSNPAAYKAAVDAGYITGIMLDGTAIPTESVAGNETTPAVTAGTLVVTSDSAPATETYIISYEWGDTFGGQNPYAYYNGMSISSKIGTGEDAPTADAHAMEHIQELYDTLSGLTFSLTIEAE
ncbi:MAG: hypothetical protein E7177_03570 [Erysipelotrichaceae bacterium]|nr:hypothetical protein [Erysipelotrichaceae bacterium]